MTWSWALVIPTPKPPITNLFYIVYVQNKHKFLFHNLSIRIVTKKQPLSKVGNPHHSIDAYRHAYHNLLISGTFSHKSTLESKESTLNSISHPKYHKQHIQ